MYKRFKTLFFLSVLLFCMMENAGTQTSDAVQHTFDSEVEHHAATDTTDMSGTSQARPQSNNTQSEEQHSPVSPAAPQETADTAVLDPNESNAKNDAAPDNTQAAENPNAQGEKQNTEAPDAVDDDYGDGALNDDLSDQTIDREIPVQDINRRAQIFRRFTGGGVSAIADSAATRSFFAAGKDGFVSRYTYSRLMPETWQVSALPVKLIAVHPKKTYLAVYETDGFSVHKISLWDWQTKKQLYTKRFTSSVLSLAWSAQGSYLFIGTASVEGITVLDARGNVKKIYPRPPGIVLLAATGPSERSIVTYGETGRLVYADISKRSILTQYETEDRLQNPELIHNYTKITGYKNGNVLVIKAASGEILESYPARSALFAGKINDTLPVWIEEGEKRFSWHLCQGDKKSPVFTVPHNARITAARHVDAAIIIGTDDGGLYRLQQENDASVFLTELNADTDIPVTDICVKDSVVHILADKTFYAVRSPAMQPEPIITDIPVPRCIAYGNGFLFWSDHKTAPLYYAEAGQQPTALYRPREAIGSVSVYGDIIAVVQTFSGLVLLDGKSGKKLFEYKAAGLQEAVQIDNDFVLIAKSTGISVQQPLLLINIKTSETIPLTLEGALAFSLRANSKIKNTFSCLRFKADESAHTDVITMKINLSHPARSTFSPVLSYSDEDLYASLYDDGYAIITNLGQNQLVYYDKNRRKAQRPVRDYALPRKAVLTDRYIVSMNYDGSLSWFRRQDMRLMQNHRLKR